MDVQTPAEAIRALCMQLKGFRKHLETDTVTGYRVLTDVEAKDENTILYRTGAATIRIVPVVSGAGKGLGQIFAGIALIFIGWWLSPLAFGAFMTSGSLWVSVGASLILGGVSQMMAKTPSIGDNTTESADNKPSFVFDGAVNTVSQGHPVPVCYGEMIVGSQVISAGLNSEQF